MQLQCKLSLCVQPNNRILYQITRKFSMSVKISFKTLYSCKSAELNKKNKRRQRCRKDENDSWYIFRLWKDLEESLKQFFFKFRCVGEFFVGVAWPSYCQWCGWVQPIQRIVAIWYLQAFSKEWVQPTTLSLPKFQMRLSWAVTISIMAISSWVTKEWGFLAILSWCLFRLSTWATKKWGCLA